MLTTGALEMDCGTCQRDKNARRRWGCDGPAPMPPMIDCPRCQGNGRGCDYPGCRAGKWKIERCPNTWLPRIYFEAVRLFSHYEAGFLPMTGGTLDQDAWTMDAMAIVRRASQEQRETK